MFPLFSLGEHYKQLTLRDRDKLSVHDLASKVAGLYVTTESSNLPVSFVDRPAFSPNLS